MLVDFHSHTWESDGSLSPAALCAFMRERSVCVFSITDHDTLGAYREPLDTGGARVVTGIEINTTWDDGEVHVLGYRLPLGDSALSRVLEANRAARRVRIARIVDLLRGAGHELTLEDVHAHAKEGASLGRPHVGKALVSLGIAPDIETAFRKFLRRGTPGYVPSTHITPYEAIDVILESGGIPVLAHPGRLRDYAMIGTLAERGLRGLEVFYPTHEAGQIQYFRDRAKQYGLLMTAGADFHDIRYHRRGVGMEVDEADIRPFLRTVER
ncbi:MAG: PHP domain-containing protein [Candidatus Baltobacteraceae bacterium]